VGNVCAQVGVVTSPLNVPIPSIDELTSNAARLLQQSLAQAAQSARPAQLSAVDLELARSNIKALAFVQGAGLYGAYAYLRDFIARQAIPILAQEEFLDGWLTTYGRPRKAAASAAGPVFGTGISSTLLPAGTLLQVDDGRQFSVQTDVEVVGGAVSAQVVAVVAGAAGNLGAGGTLTLVTPVSGIDLTFTADPVSGLSGGAEVEKDSDAAYRLQQRLSNEPMGGTPADYARWALSVPAITRAWGVRNPSGPTTAGVLIMADGNEPDGLPTIAQRDQVLDYIRDPRRGPPDELFIIIPTLVPINWHLALTPDTPAIRSSVKAALKDVFFREAVPGGSIPHAHPISAISNVVGEYNFQVISPPIVLGDFFTTAAFDQLLVLGEVDFS
jgi:uncharacterized phage protein gp47/JayE